ncbi:MAG: AI-2E family transporter [Paracoccaceae bacterium]
MDKTAQLGIVVIAVILLVAALQVGSPLLAPITLALVVGVVLSPLTDLWERLGLTTGTGALISVSLTILFIGGLGLIFQPLVSQMVDQAPKVWSDMRDTIEVFRGFLRGLSQVTQEMASAAMPPAQAQAQTPPEAAITMPPVTEALFMVPAIAGQMMIFIGTLFFFLMTRGEIYDWAARRLAAPSNRAVMARRMRHADRHVARYFMTVSAINAVLGLIAFAGLAGLGLPGAALWGVIIFVMNFIVYLGPVVVIFGLLFAGVAAFDGGMGLAPAALYVGLNSIEGQFVTPALLGRTMAVNPLLVFLSIVFGLWLWGAIGGIVAIPALLWLLVLSDELSQDAPSA